MDAIFDSDGAPVNDWLPLIAQGATVISTVLGAVVMLTQRITRLEGRIENLTIEIRKDRELVEHRIRQLELGLGQVRSELTRLSYTVGGLRLVEKKETT
jgi:hypothetical protein